MSRVSHSLLRWCAVALVTASTFGAASSASALDPDPTPTVSSAAGAYYPLSAVRLLGAGRAGSLPSAGSDVTPARPVSVAVLGRFGIPASGASAAVVNLTLTSATTTVALSAAPRSGPLSTGTTSAALTAPAGATRTALVTVPLDPTGSFALGVRGGTATVTADLVGLYAADDTLVAAWGSLGGYQPIDAVRLAGAGAGSSSSVTPVSDLGSDSLLGNRFALPSPTPTISAGLADAIPAGGSRTIGVDLGAGPTTHATALVLRVGVDRPAAAGSISVTAGDPAASTGSAQTTVASTQDAAVVAAVPTLSLSEPGTAAAVRSTTNGLAIVPAHAAADGLLDVTVTNGTAAPADVTLDLVGYYDDGLLGPDLRFRALPSTRVVDTRRPASGGPVAVGKTRTVSAPPEVVGVNTFALVGSLTVLTPARPATDVSLLPAAATGTPVPGSVHAAGDTQTTTPAQVEVGSSGTLVLASSSAADVVLDVIGSFEANPAVPDVGSRAWVHPTSAWQVRALIR